MKASIFALATALLVASAAANDNTCVLVCRMFSRALWFAARLRQGCFCRLAAAYHPALQLAAVWLCCSLALWVARPSDTALDCYTEVSIKPFGLTGCSPWQVCGQ